MVSKDLNTFYLVVFTTFLAFHVAEMRTFYNCQTAPLCNTLKCCARGYRYEWPELIGRNGQEAKQIIEKDNPIVAAVIVPEHGVMTFDFCCNRVWVFVNNAGKVRSVPKVG